jgi:hypothetical protein
MSLQFHLSACNSEPETGFFTNEIQVGILSPVENFKKKIISIGLDFI